MAKKKRNQAPAKTSEPAKNTPPKTEEGEKIIDQLFGRLDQEPDIENDIAELGGVEEAEAQPDEKPQKSRFFFGFAIFVVIMALIGCFSTVKFIANFTGSLLDNTSLKNEFAQFIFPVVINDIAPFENADEIPDSSKISCSIWNIILNSDTTEFETDGSMGLTIPEYNVSASCRELFGSSVSLQHQTVGTAEMRFTYDEATHTYSASKNIRYLTYSPKIISVNKNSDAYTVVVGYLPPTVAAVAGVSGLSASPEKYMEYTISRFDGNDTLLSVRFSDYQPQTEEASIRE